jgi:type IV pilus assembly protein PilM
VSKSLFKRELRLRGRKSAQAPSSKRRSGGRGKSKQIVGLKIGATQIAAAVVANNGMPRLVEVARDELAPGVVSGGEVVEPEALTQALDSFFTKHDLPRRNIRLGVGSNRIGVRLFERPPVDDPQQLANAIRFRANEALPIPIEEAMLDYHVLEDASGPGHVLLAVSYRELVDRFAYACRAANLQLMGIDLEAFALLRALSQPVADRPEQRRAAVVATALGHERTIVAVSDGRVCEFVRVLDWGGAKLTSAIEKALGVKTDEAETIKRSLSFLADTETGPEAEQAKKALEAVKRELASLGRELVSSLEFYQAQPNALAIAEVTLTGGTSQLPGLDDELQRLMGVRVRVGDPFTRVGTPKEDLANGAAGSLTVPIGLGIED